MISVAELLKNRPITGNFFAPDAYVQGDFESGLIESREGSRLIALPQTLLRGIYTAILQETGEDATPIILFRVGTWWGRNFYRRFSQELASYTGKPLSEMPMPAFAQALKQCWRTYGWGILELDFESYQYGFLVARVRGSAFIEIPEADDCESNDVEAGILSAFFSQISGRDLHCLQTSFERRGAEQNTFIIGLENRLSQARAWVEDDLDHESILTRLKRLPPTD